MGTFDYTGLTLNNPGCTPYFKVGKLENLIPAATLKPHSLGNMYSQVLGVRRWASLGRDPSSITDDPTADLLLELGTAGHLLTAHDIAHICNELTVNIFALVSTSLFGLWQKVW